MNFQGREKLIMELNSDERNWAILQENGWTHLTDWTFTSIFSLPALIKEGSELINKFSKGKFFRGRPFNKFVFTFGDTKGRLDVWGKLEEDYQI